MRVNDPSTDRDLDKIIGSRAGLGFQRQDPVEDLTAAFQAAEPEALRSGESFFLVKAASIVLGQEQEMASFFAEAYLQIARMCMLESIVHYLLYHPEDVYLLFFGDLDLFDYV